VAAREIGHAIGFFSGVEQIDFSAYSGTKVDGLDVYVTPLDFTRFSADSQTAGADIDMTADARDKYFSLDGGVTVLVANAWSTGFNFGVSLGLLDPTLGFGELGLLSTLDLTAFDVMGFELTSTAVPEPGQYLVLAVLCGAAGYRRYGRKRLSVAVRH